VATRSDDVTSTFNRVLVELLHKDRVSMLFPKTYKHPQCLIKVNVAIFN